MIANHYLEVNLSFNHQRIQFISHENLMFSDLFDELKTISLLIDNCGL